MIAFRSEDKILLQKEPIAQTNTYWIQPEWIRGKIDGREALEQAVGKMLSTERFEYPVYSFRYGISLKKLLGKDRIYVKAELKRMIEETLISDDRIKRVDQFRFSFKEDTCECVFRVVSIYGEFMMERKVNL